MQGCLRSCYPSLSAPLTHSSLPQPHEHAFVVRRGEVRRPNSRVVRGKRRCPVEAIPSLSPDSSPSLTVTDSATLYRPCTAVPERARAMTTFAPTSQPNSDLPDGPHHHHHHQQPPPPQHLSHGAFAHQLNPPASSFTSNNSPQVSRRASRDLRHHASNGAMAGPNGNGPMAVPGGRMANGNGHGGNMREAGFNGARSPPNNKSRCKHACASLHSR
jgi:hypothetical protein